MRRAQPLHPATLLIDQHGRIRPIDAGAQGLGQGAHLLRRLDVSLEEDEAPRTDLPEEVALAFR
jgi:hypothetical protein